LVVNISHILTNAFVDELEKIAVTTQQLAAGSKGIAGHVNLGGMAGLKRLFTRPRDTSSVATQMAQRAGIRGGVDTAYSNMTKRQANQRTRLLKKHNIPLPDEHIERAIRAHPGRIVTLGPRAVATQLGAKKISKPGRAALYDATVMHEQFERAVKPRDMNLAYMTNRGHRSTDVLAKEHNMLSRLEGPGAHEARKALRGARQARGETAELQKLLVDTYGPRAAQFMQEGRKIPKAMRKDLLRKTRASMGGSK
jgi:hypothetical protein